jgi:hypothetical protein
MTWSQSEALSQRKRALRLLLDESGKNFTRASEWFEQSESVIPDGIWSLLNEEGLVHGNVMGGKRWRLTVDGWIEACRLLRDEINLDDRFGALSRHLKDLGARGSDAFTTFREVAAATDLSEEWVLDAVRGRMAERIFHQHGAITHRGGIVEIPPHIGVKLS